VETTVGRLLIDRALPPAYRGRPGPLDGKAMAALFQEMAEKDPDLYRDSVKNLMDIGREVSYQTGGYSFGLSDMLVPPEVEARRNELRTAVRNILRRRDVPEAEKSKQVVDLMEKSKPILEKLTYDVTRAAGNPLAMQVATGTRGKPANVQGIIAGEGLYADHHDRSIPFPVLHGFAEGLTPAEYFAGSFGNRKSLYDVKMGTANAGAYGKILSRAAHRLAVTAIDADDPLSIADRGVPVETMDPDNDGALLALPAGGYPRNTPITPAVMKELQSKGISRIAVRSPIASGPPDGGVYSRDLGYREHGKGRLADIAEAVGLAAAQAIAEPVSQGALSSKHKGGTAEAAKKTWGPGGFSSIEQAVTSPSESAYWAGHAERDGTVAAIKPSPTGGIAVYIDGQEHLIAPGQDATVKVGDHVEAGDVLSDGMPNPRKFVEHKGIGEGRRAFVDSYRQILKENNIGAHRRNIELLARGLVDHVRATDSFGPYLPDDVTPYDRIEADWVPRPGHITTKAREAKNMFLEKPVLHYTLGTRITPRVIKELQGFGINDVTAHPDPPPFKPEYVSGSNTLFYDPDWQTRMYGSYLQKGTLKAVWEGAESDEEGTSFVPALARGVDFGLKGRLLRPGAPVPDNPPAVDVKPN
jgi:DNA-directed RNA polymerase subunit beta'